MIKTDGAIFELIDLASGNVIDDFESINDALESIRRVASKHGWDSVSNLSLMRVAGDDQLLFEMKEPLARLARSLPGSTKAAR
jgi:hypothetical protein